MRELAEHLFTWGGELLIEGPETLVAVMRERLDTAQTMLPIRHAAKRRRPILSQKVGKRPA